MGYRVVYFNENKKSNLRRIILSLVFFVLFIIWTFHNWGEGRSFILEVLFPVSSQEAEYAIGEMIQSLENGQDMGETIGAFFQTVFPGHGEGLY